jgi:hypothetical protein
MLPQLGWMRGSLCPGLQNDFDLKSPPTRRARELGGDHGPSDAWRFPERYSSDAGTNAVVAQGEQLALDRRPAISLRQIEQPVEPVPENRLLAGGVDVQLDPWARGAPFGLTAQAIAQRASAFR